MRDASDVFFIFENIDSGEHHYIFKNNVLRFRQIDAHSPINPGWAADKVYVQFVLKGAEKVSFYINKIHWIQFKTNLPAPPKCYCVTPPSASADPYNSRDVEVDV